MGTISETFTGSGMVQQRNGPAPSSTRRWASHLNEVEYQGALRDATIAMPRSLDGGVPAEFRDLFYSVSRSAPRRPHIMGHYPVVAPALTAYGACVSDVLRPAWEVERRVWSVLDERDGLCLEEAQFKEAHAEGMANEAQLALASCVSARTVTEAREKLFVHKCALKRLLRLLDQMDEQIARKR